MSPSTVIEKLLKFIPFLRNELKLAREEIRQGRFQRSMAAFTGTGALIGGFEAYLQHLHGALKHWQMWTPIFLTPPAALAAGGSVLSKELQKSFLPALQIVSLAWLAAGGIGSFYHVRGVQRLPGGFRLGRYNMTMGPPLFAPLLLTGIGTMGIIAGMLRPEKADDLDSPDPQHAAPESDGPSAVEWKLAPKTVAEVSHGRFQGPMGLTTAFFSGLVGGEVYFEHLHGSFNKKMMWAPVLLTPPLITAGIGAKRSAKIGGKPLAVISVANIVLGMVGSFFHLRAVRRMPGGFSNMKFNIADGPPPLAPLLFTMVGTMGLVASLLRREGK